MFYIDSIGHSASGWLSNNLNKHPKIVCFHGTRSFPPIETANYNNKLYKEINLIDFCNALHECSKNSRYEKFFE